MERLKKYAQNINVQLDSTAINRFEKYMNIVLEWNTKINLTSITDKDEFIVKHFCDSISVIANVDIPQNSKIIDIGTGAGFPAIPILIARPDLKITMLDSLNKRLIFIKEQVLPVLDLNASVVHARAEEFSHKSEYRENFDFAVSRAVANLSALSEYCIPFVKVGGKFISMKGFDSEDEISVAQNAIEILGGKIVDVKKFVLPDNSGRSIVITDKIKNTPGKYPRRAVKINKNPL